MDELLRKGVAVMPNSSADDATVKDKASLALAFDRHDLNRVGRLTLGEFIRLLAWLDGRISTEDCAIIFDRLDAGHSGAVEFGPFFDWWIHRI
jgi:Ca2+-binding EF-hand superfamily protein